MNKNIAEKMKSLSFGEGSKIIVYEGKEGLRQITKNSLEAKDGLRVIEASYASLGEMFDQKEADEFRKEYLKRKTKIMEITNHAYHDYTIVDGFDETCMDTRYIDPKKFKIDVETLIYNDIVAYYTYEGSNQFCFEVVGKRFTETQKRMFDALWNLCERPIVGRGGRSSMF